MLCDQLLSGVGSRVITLVFCKAGEPGAPLTHERYLICEHRSKAKVPWETTDFDIAALVTVPRTPTVVVDVVRVHPPEVEGIKQILKEHELRLGRNALIAMLG